MNIESLDVLNHKKLLDAARADTATISFSVRPVNILLPAIPQPPLSGYDQASPMSPEILSTEFKVNDGATMGG